MPNGVFEPYTPIPTNLLFFKACDPDIEGQCTQEVWYYEIPLPEGRNKYTKTNPLQWEEFAGCLEWWDNREEHQQAWRISAESIANSGYNLDRKNPVVRVGPDHLPPEQSIEAILEKERRVLELMEKIKQTLATGVSHPSASTVGMVAND